MKTRPTKMKRGENNYRQEDSGELALFLIICVIIYLIFR